jgi:PiT family inorganic phosphate transporter
VVLAQALVLFLFSSEALEGWLSSRGLPTVPLVPVSSSQAVIGAVLGIGLAKGGRNIRWRVLGRIASGWVATPAVSAVMALLLLFLVQNVFSQRVCAPAHSPHSTEVADHREGAPEPALLAGPGDSSTAPPSRRSAWSPRWTPPGDPLR